MTARRLSEFAGVMPRRARRLLPDSNAQVAANCLVTSGVMSPIYGPLLTQTLSSTTPVRTVFRLDDNGGDAWLEWPYDVDVARGPLAGNATPKIYYTAAEFEPRVTSLPQAALSPPFPTSCFVLGVTPPPDAPSLAVVGGSAANDTRLYVYTYVTSLGEESAPSPASAATTGPSDGTWGLTGLSTAPSNTYAVSAVSWSSGVLTFTVASSKGLRAGESVTLSGLVPASLNVSMRVASVPDATHFTVAMAVNPGTISDPVGTATRDAPHNTSGMTKRIYRSVTAGDLTDYFFVAEIPVSTTSYNDTVVDIGEPCPTFGWEMPPTDMRGILFHSSGAAVGFSSVGVCFSEPGSPYAWPVSYRVATDSAVVGIGVFGQTVVVATQGVPYVISGVEPASMAPQKVEQPWPCLSKRSVVSMGFGVAFACPLGLAFIGVEGTQLLTNEHYTFVEWAKLHPSSFVATHFDSRYYAVHTREDGTGGMWVFGRGSVVTGNTHPTAVYTDSFTGRFYIVDDNRVYEWMGNVGRKLNGDWMSKEYVEPSPVNLSAARIDGEFRTTPEEEAAAQAEYALVLAANELLVSTKATKGGMGAASLNTYSLNGSALAALPPLDFSQLQFTLYTDNVAVFSVEVQDTNIFRLPTFDKYDNYALRVSGNVVVNAVLVGSSPIALKQV